MDFMPGQFVLHLFRSNPLKYSNHVRSTSECLSAWSMVR